MLYYCTVWCIRSNKISEYSGKIIFSSGPSSSLMINALAEHRTEKQGHAPLVNSLEFVLSKAITMYTVCE